MNISYYTGVNALRRAPFIRRLSLGIFRSVEWATVLAAAEEARYNEPIVLLARSPIHLSNRQVVENIPSASSDCGGTVGGVV